MSNLSNLDATRERHSGTILIIRKSLRCLEHGTPRPGYTALRLATLAQCELGEVP